MIISYRYTVDSNFMSAYCAVKWTPWLCRNFPHFFQNHAVILPIFYCDFNTLLHITIEIAARLELGLNMLHNVGLDAP